MKNQERKQIVRSLDKVIDFKKIAPNFAGFLLEKGENIAWKYAIDKLYDNVLPKLEKEKADVIDLSLKAFADGKLTLDEAHELGTAIDTVVDIPGIDDGAEKDLIMDSIRLVYNQIKHHIE